MKLSSGVWVPAVFLALTLNWAGAAGTANSLGTPATEEQVDLQWSICDSSPEVVLQKLVYGFAQRDLSVREADKSPEKSKDQKVVYYDTNPPSYAQVGLSFRTKEKKKSLMSSVKVRFDDASQGVPEGAVCSWDRYGTQETYTCEQRAFRHTGLGGDVSEGPWSEEQMGFVSRYHRVQWDQLVAFGPFKNLKWTLKLGQWAATFDSVDTGHAHLMELSVKVARADNSSVYQAVSNQLKKQGVVLCERQEGKTTRLLRSMGLLP